MQEKDKELELDVVFLKGAVRKWARRFIDGHFEMSITPATKVKDNFVRKYGFSFTRQIVGQIENEVGREMQEEVLPYYEPHRIKPFKPRTTVKVKQKARRSREYRRPFFH